MPQCTGWKVAALLASSPGQPVPALAGAVSGQDRNTTHGGRAGADRVFPRDGDSRTPNRNQEAAASCVAPINPGVTAAMVPGTIASVAPLDRGLAGAAHASSTRTHGTSMTIDGHPALVGTSGAQEDAGGRGRPLGLARDDPRARDGSRLTIAAEGSTQVTGSHVNRDGSRVADVPESAQTPSTFTCQAPTPVACNPSPVGVTRARATVADVDGDPLTATWWVDGVSVGEDRAGSSDSAVEGEVPFTATRTSGSHPVVAWSTPGWASTSCEVTVAVVDTLPPAPPCPGGVTPDASTQRGAAASYATPAETSTHGPVPVFRTPASLPGGVISLLSRLPDPALRVGGQHPTTVDREVMESINWADVRVRQVLDGTRSDSIPSETLLAVNHRAVVPDRLSWWVGIDEAVGSDPHLVDEADKQYARSDGRPAGGETWNAPGDRKDAWILATHAAPPDR